MNTDAVPIKDSIRTIRNRLAPQLPFAFVEDYACTGPLSPQTQAIPNPIHNHKVTGKQKTPFRKPTTGIFNTIIRRHTISLLTVVASLLFPLFTFGATENVATSVSVTKANEKSSLDRATGKLTSTAEITLTNTGTRRVEPPLHAVLQLSGAASYTGLQATGASGRLNAAPYNAF